MQISWEVQEKESINMTLHVNKAFDGGFIGIGWDSELMLDAEIWFCNASKTVDPRLSCNEIVPENNQEDTEFTCCVAEAKSRARPTCEKDTYKLEVVESCISGDEAFVKVRAPLCEESETGKCFNLTEGEREFIAAYRPDKVSAHGFSRRTSGMIDLRSGEGGGSGSDASNAGLFAFHGFLMLVCWFILIPVAIWIVRYRKEKPWRLGAHLGLVGVTGSMVISVAGAVIFSVEGVSFGTVEGGSVFSNHKTMGIIVILLNLFMAATGEVRFTRELTSLVENPRIDRIIFLLHRSGGIVLLAAAWYK